MFTIKVIKQLNAEPTVKLFNHGGKEIELENAEFLENPVSMVINVPGYWVRKEVKIRKKKGDKDA